MTIPFYKYHGAGNDFIMIDNRTLKLPVYEPSVYQTWCDRRMGIGADGVIFLNDHPDCDFEMLYINADGGEGSMCGNGGRCILAFAKFLGIMEQEALFMAYDGLHRGKIEGLPINWNGIGKIEWVALEMGDVSSIEADPINKEDFVLDTGSPHYVQFVESADKVDTLKEGKEIRYNANYKEKGINVNFIEVVKEQYLKICTYERGVEAVTLACGTGATAAAVSYLKKEKKANGPYVVYLETEGGPLEISLTKTGESTYANLWLKGPAVQVYKGDLQVLKGV